jgi:tetratricopeptide (TPR) repeat protein
VAGAAGFQEIAGFESGRTPYCKEKKIVRIRRLFSLLLVVAGAAKAQAQLPDSFTNLKVLAPGISHEDLVSTMKGFTRGLGVRCSFCHVGDDAKGWGSFDFKSDEKAPKQTARTMMSMVQDINQKQLASLSAREGIKVQCVTCHHGLKEPRLIEDVLADVDAKAGLDSAVARYRMLREKYYGGYSFDFSERSLLSYADSKWDQADTAGAIRWTELNIEYNPQSAHSYFQLGMIQAEAGMHDAAVASVTKALEIDPELPPARKLLEKLTTKE